MSGKRKDYISWDEYFMGVAVLSGMRSKDPIFLYNAQRTQCDLKLPRRKLGGRNDLCYAVSLQ